MITKKLILISLLFTYTLIIGHGLIHHVHNEADNCLSTYKIFSNHDHCQNTEFNLHDFFNNFNHSGNKEVLNLRSFKLLAKISSNKYQSVFAFQNILNSNNPPPYFFVTNENSEINSSKILFSSKGLRAPPLS